MPRRKYVERAMTARHGPHQKSVCAAPEHGFASTVAGCEKLSRRIRADAVTDVMAMEKVYLLDRLSRCRQQVSESFACMVHVPIARPARVRADFRLNAVYRADPIGMRSDQGPVCALFFKKSFRQRRKPLQRQFNSRLLSAQIAHEPAQRQMRIERGGNELVVECIGLGRELLVQKSIPVRLHEPNPGAATVFLGSRVVFMVIHHHDLVEVQGFMGARTEQLSHVERAVTATAQDNEAH